MKNRWVVYKIYDLITLLNALHLGHCVSTTTTSQEWIIGYIFSKIGTSGSIQVEWQCIFNGCRAYFISTWQTRMRQFTSRFQWCKSRTHLLNKNVTTQLVKSRCPCLNGLPLPIQLLLCQYITTNEMNTRYKKHMMEKNHSYWLGDPFVERVLEQSLPNWYPHWSTTTMRSTQLLWRQTCCSSFSSIG